MSGSSDVDKTKLADQLRQLIGEDIAFERLSKEDLFKLWTKLTSLPLIAQVGGKTIRLQVTEKLMNRKLSDILGTTSLQAFAAKAGEGGGGVFGLGILPSITKSLTSPLEPPKKAATEQAQ